MSFSLFKEFNVETRKYFIFLFVFMFVFFMPVLAYIGLLIFYLILIKKTKKTEDDFKHIEVEKLLTMDELLLIKRFLGEGAIVSYITNQDLNPDLRLKAFIIISEIISPLSIQFLKFGLRDKNDEIRLLCFSLINSLDEKINNEIFKLNKILKNSNAKDLKLKLAKLYWEMIYLQLADETFKEYYINNIIDILKNNSSKEAKMILLRVYLMKKDYENVSKILEQLEINSDTVTYFIEAAYYKKDFKTVKKLIEQYPEIKYIEKFYNIYRLWHDT
ncbi:hypothetical protein NAMH_1431 [Nautilia profundicola AmH]|uniref:HEAT repeat domain-containing protein n=2 Tax=Nautilia TaxID=191291 RepID=B9L635_NAUPA|nr:hypothetical protein NAMH_1431 [Nautilia profundicola AmH]